MQNTTEQPPSGFSHFLWLVKHWKKYWKELTGYVLFLLVLALSWQFIGILHKAIRSHYATVSVRIINFDYSTGELTLEFKNDTEKSVPVENLYLTVSSTNSVPMKPIPDELMRLVSIFSRNVIRLPGGAGIETRPAPSPNDAERRAIRTAAFFLAPDKNFILPSGSTLTNLTPEQQSFPKICDGFAEGAALDLVLNTCIVDIKGRGRAQSISLGKYFVGSHYRGIKGYEYPKEVDIYRRARIMGKNRFSMIYTVHGSVELPTSQERNGIALYMNQSSNDTMVIVGERIRGLVPVILTKKSLSYNFMLNIEIDDGEKLPSDIKSWIMTSDNGQTVMTPSVAFSNELHVTDSNPATGKEYSIPLSSTNWQVMVSDHKWARILSGDIRYSISEKSWINLIPPEDVTQTMILSNYNSVAMQEASSDLGWVALTNAPLVKTFANTYILVQNNITPEHAIFSTQLNNSVTISTVNGLSRYGSDGL